MWRHNQLHDGGVVTAGQHVSDNVYNTVTDSRSCPNTHKQHGYKVKCRCAFQTHVKTIILTQKREKEKERNNLFHKKISSNIYD